MPLRRLTLPFELEIAGNSARWVEDEVLIVERNVAVVLEVFALVDSEVAVRRHRRFRP